MKFKDSRWRFWSRSTAPKNSFPAASGPLLPQPGTVVDSIASTSQTPLPKSTNPPEELLTLEEIRCEVWNEAYDLAQQENGALVEAYEKILSAQLSAEELSPLVSKDTPNRFKGDRLQRQEQMKNLLDMGLSKTEKGFNRKKQIGERMKLIQNIKSIISTIAQADSSVAIAWGGISACIQVIESSMSEPTINRKGLDYVLDRIQWYWELSQFLLPNISIRKRIWSKLIQLYKELLLYQMKSVCLYNMHWARVILNDLVQKNDWQGQIDAIQAVENSLRQDIQDHGSQEQLRIFDNVNGLLQQLVDRQENVKNEMIRIEKSAAYKDCMKVLWIINPQDHRTKIQDIKGTLLKNAYSWILEERSFQNLRDHDDDCRLLWIKGDPGKGKTMLVCGIIEELETDLESTLAYFFCQATEERLQSSTAVLRGIIWLLCKKHPQLISYVEERYKTEGETFQAHTAFQALKDILLKILQDPQLENAIIIVDALDECADDSRQELIQLIIRCSCDYSARWIVSSRNWLSIEEQFFDANKTIICLESNDGKISQAVQTFIESKVEALAQRKKYDQYDPKLKGQVRDILLQKANNTFLWVSLACIALDNPSVRSWGTIDKLESMPAGLNDLYGRMLEQINTSQKVGLYEQILATAALTFRPLHIDELHSLVAELEGFNDLAVREMVGDCASFLTLKEDSIYLIHQSAKEYLLENSSEAFPSSQSDQHRTIFYQSLKKFKELKRNVYELNSPATCLDDILPPKPDPLSSLEYSCVYWVDHFEQLNQTENSMQYDQKAIQEFMDKRLLFWLEALSLKRKITEGIFAIKKLKGLMQHTAVETVTDFIEDVHRFVLTHRAALDIAPLQIYPALGFSPTRSLVRRQYEENGTDWEIIPSGLPTHWDACMHTFDSEPNWVMTLSPTGRELVHAPWGRPLEVWDMSSGHCSRKLSIVCDKIAFSPDGGQLAVALTRPYEIEILDFKSDVCIRKLFHEDSKKKQYAEIEWRAMNKIKREADRIHNIKFSPDGKLLASCSRRDIKIWEVSTGKCVRTIKPTTAEEDILFSLSFSADGELLVSSSGSICRTLNPTIWVWNTATGQLIWELKGDNFNTHSIAFLSDGRLAYVSLKNTVKILDMTKGTCVQILQGHRGWVTCVASLDNGHLVSGSWDGTIKIWNDQGVCVSTLNGKGCRVYRLSFCASAKLLASASAGNIKVWDSTKLIDTGDAWPHSDQILRLAASPDSKWFASSSMDKTIKIWDTSSGMCIHTLQATSNRITQLKISLDGFWLLSQDRELLGVSVWNASSGNLVRHFELVNQSGFTSPHQVLVLVFNQSIQTWDIARQDSPRTLDVEGVGSNMTRNIVCGFSHNTENLASATGGRIFIHNVVTGQLVNEFQALRDINKSNLPGVAHDDPTDTDRKYISSLAFSPTGKYLASETNRYIEIWDITTGNRAKLIDHYSAIGISPRFDLLDDYQIHIRGVILDWSSGQTHTSSCILSHSYSLSKDRV